MYNFISNSPIAILCLLTLAALAHALGTWSYLLAGTQISNPNPPIPISYPLRYRMSRAPFQSVLSLTSFVSHIVCSEFPFTIIILSLVRISKIIMIRLVIVDALSRCSHFYLQSTRVRPILTWEKTHIHRFYSHESVFYHNVLRQKKMTRMATSVNLRIEMSNLNFEVSTKWKLADASFTAIVLDFIFHIVDLY